MIDTQSSKFRERVIQFIAKRSESFLTKGQVYSSSQALDEIADVMEMSEKEKDADILDMKRGDAYAILSLLFQDIESCAFASDYDSASFYQDITLTKNMMNHVINQGMYGDPLDDDEKELIEMMFETFEDCAIRLELYGDSRVAA